MRLDVLLTPGELVPGEIAGRTVVVLDVLRATTSIVEAMASGARTLFPVATIEEAIGLAKTLGRDEVLLAGERKALPIEGFDLGNSPGEFTAERVGGKFVVMSTTNGTLALMAAASGERVIVGAWTNFQAVVDDLVRTEADPVFLCAGRDRVFGLEDAVCAGQMAAALMKALPDAEWEMNDGAVAALALAEEFPDPVASSFPTRPPAAPSWTRGWARTWSGAPARTCATCSPCWKAARSCWPPSRRRADPGALTASVVRLRAIGCGSKEAGRSDGCSGRLRRVRTGWRGAGGWLDRGIPNPGQATGWGALTLGRGGCARITRSRIRWCGRPAHACFAEHRAIRMPSQKIRMAPAAFHPSPVPGIPRRLVPRRQARHASAHQRRLDLTPNPEKDWVHTEDTEDAEDKNSVASVSSV